MENECNFSRNLQVQNTITHKICALTNRYERESGLSSDSDIKLFRVYGQSGRKVPNWSNFAYWASVHLHHTLNPREFWNWLYITRDGSISLNEEDLLSVMSDEVLCDGTLRYRKTNYLADSPYLIRDNMIFALSITGDRNRQFIFNVASTRRLKGEKGDLVINEGNRSQKIVSWTNNESET